MATAVESRFELAFEAAVHPTILASLDGRLVAINRAMRDVLGLAVNLEPSSLGLGDLIAHPEHLCDIVERLVEAGRFDELEIEFNVPNARRRMLRVSGTRLRGSDKDSCFVISAWPMPTKAGASATKSSRSSASAFERMASTTAHDLNNVLSAMTGYCHIMRDSLLGNAQALADLSGIEEAGERAAAIVRQLSAIGQRQMLRPAAINPARQIEARESVLRRMLPQGVDLQITTVRAGCEISIDPDVFDEIVMILALNARKSMPDGGWLHVRISTAPNDRDVFIDVMDTGASLRPFNLDMNFDPFETNDVSGPYSTLALAAVHTLVVRSGGTISAESAPGFGTTFRVTFPVVDRLALASPADSSEGDDATTTRGGRVFVVDDDPPLRMLTERVLTLQGYEVIEARSGEEALNILETLDDGLDLLLTDVMMPGIKGWEVGRAVHERFPDCAVIYMSGYHDARIRHELGENSLFLSKPFTPPKLTSAVSSALRDRRRRSV